MSLESAVSSAVDSHVKEDVKISHEDTPEGAEITITETPESGSEDEESEEESEEDSGEAEEEISDDEVKEAKDLYKALKGPNAKEVIALLAKQTGLSEVDSKTDVKESKKKILDIFKESLGPEFEFIADRISKGVETVLEQERQERNAKEQNEKADKIAGEVKDAWNQLAKSTNGESKKFEAKMIELAKEILPGPSTSAKQYLGRLYTLASAGKNNVSDAKKVVEKIQKNSNDTSGRLRATGGAEGKTPAVFTGKGVGKAVDFAYDQLMKGKK